METVAQVPKYNLNEEQEKRLILREYRALLRSLKGRIKPGDRKMIRHALARSEGNISNTARLLGISRPTLYDLLKQYDLQT